MVAPPGKRTRNQFYRVCDCGIYQGVTHPVRSAAEWDRHQDFRRLAEYTQKQSETSGPLSNSSTAAPNKSSIESPSKSQPFISSDSSDEADHNIQSPQATSSGEQRQLLKLKEFKYKRLRRKITFHHPESLQGQQYHEISSSSGDEFDPHHSSLPSSSSPHTTQDPIGFHDADDEMDQEAQPPKSTAQLPAGARVSHHSDSSERDVDLDDDELDDNSDDEHGPRANSNQASIMITKPIKLPNILSESEDSTSNSDNVPRHPPRQYAPDLGNQSDINSSPSDSSTDSEDDISLVPGEINYKNIRQHPTKSDLLSLALFDVKTSGNTSRAQTESYTRICKAACPPGVKPSTMRTTVSRLIQRTGINLISYDCCINSCFCFYNSNLTHCPNVKCQHPRWKGADSSSKDKIPFKTFDYLPLIPRLKLQFSDPNRARELMEYRQKLEEWAKQNPTLKRDFWTGDLFGELRNQKGLFNTPETQAYILSTDGFRVFFRRKPFSAWPFLLIPLNISPATRAKRRNLLPTGICPGPKGPWDLDSFLRPMVDEFLILEKGIPDVWNAYTCKTFTLFAHIVIVSGDQPAREKMCNHYGSSGNRYCTYCYAHGVFKSHVYCPFKPPSDPPPNATNQEQWKTYHPERLPPRLDAHWREDASNITNSANVRRADELCIRGFCELMKLQSLDFPRSFPIDAMHLFYINIIPGLFNHYRGRFFKAPSPPKLNVRMLHSKAPKKTKSKAKSAKKPRKIPPSTQRSSSSSEDSSDNERSDSETSDAAPSAPLESTHQATSTAQQSSNMRKVAKFVQTDDRYCISPKVWNQIGKDMDLSAATFPSQFGDALRSIEASCHNFKAHEWSVWTHSLSPLYLKDHLPPDIYHEYLRLVHAIMLATEDTISLSEISEIRSAFTRFLLHYEAQYYQFKWERLSAARSVFHMLAHVADCISLLGPMNVYTQWSMERFCGSIARLTTNKALPNRNMSINLHNEELKNHARYIIDWNSLDEQVMQSANNADAEFGSTPPSILWRVCVERIRRDYSTKDTPVIEKSRSKHLLASEMTALRVIGPSKAYTLSNGELRKLRQHFSSYIQTVDLSESDSDTEIPEMSVNVKKITPLTRSWYGARILIDGEAGAGWVCRPFVSKANRTHSRDASLVLYNTTLIDGNVNDWCTFSDDNLSGRCYAQVLKIISLRFMGVNHSLAYVRDIKVSAVKPRFHSIKTLPGNTRFIKLSQLAELVGHIVVGKEKYIVRNGTAMF